MVVDDELAESTWEQELYAAGVLEDAELFFMGIKEAIRRFSEFQDRSRPGALLTRGTSAMRALAEAGLLEGKRVNVGGLHHAPGRRQAADYVFLGPEEAADLRAISERVEAVSARDVPTAPRVSLARLLDAEHGS